MNSEWLMKEDRWRVKMMDTKHILLIGLILTSLLTALVLVEVLPGLAIAMIALLSGLGFTYYAGLSRNRLEYIAQQRVMMKFDKNLLNCRELSEVERVIKKYALQIVPCQKAIVLRDGNIITAVDGLGMDCIEELMRWVDENQSVLVIDNHNPRPADLRITDHFHSLLALPILSRQNNYGLVIMLNKEDQTPFSARQIEMLEYVVLQAAQIISLLLDHGNQQVYQMELLKALVKAIDAQETGFAGHSERVADITGLLGSKLGLDEDEKRDLYYSALLHDIGKIGHQRPNDCEPDGLDAQDHSSRGALILKGIPGLETVREGILYHHERYDGSGRPQGLSATKIPFNARIIAVADLYDALTRLCALEDRLSHKQAIQAVKRASGSILDPLVVVALEEVEASMKAQDPSG